MNFLPKNQTKMSKTLTENQKKISFELAILLIGVTVLCSRTGARFSVRVSAVEIVGKSENLKDLLGDQGMIFSHSISFRLFCYHLVMWMFLKISVFGLPFGNQKILLSSVDFHMAVYLIPISKCCTFFNSLHHWLLTSDFGSEC